MIVSYAEQLIEIAEDAGVSLIEATRRAGVPTSTFYRSIVGTRSLRYDVAAKIADAIESIALERSVTAQAA
jgi:predicted transcriptional regulator